MAGRPCQHAVGLGQTQAPAPVDSRRAHLALERSGFGSAVAEKEGMTHHPAPIKSPPGMYCITVPYAPNEMHLLEQAERQLDLGGIAHARVETPEGTVLCRGQRPMQTYRERAKTPTFALR